MSLDRSLRAANSLKRHRNVLKRDERLSRLEGEGKFPEGRSILGMPKIANRKMAVGGKAAKEAEAATETAGAAPAGGAPTAGAGKPAAAAAKPAAGAAKTAAAPAKAAAAKPAGKK